MPVPTPDVYHSVADDSPACVLLMQDLSDWQSPDQLIGPTPGQTRLPEGSVAAARTIAASMDRMFDHMASGPQTLMHYDYRVENMLFRPDDPEAFCLVDWQLVMRGRPGWDFAYLERRSVQSPQRSAHRRRGPTGVRRGAGWRLPFGTGLSWLLNRLHSEACALRCASR